MRRATPPKLPKTKSSSESHSLPQKLAQRYKTLVIKKKKTDEFTLDSHFYLQKDIKIIY